MGTAISTHQPRGSAGLVTRAGTLQVRGHEIGDAVSWSDIGAPTHPSFASSRRMLLREAHGRLTGVVDIKRLQAIGRTGSPKGDNLARGSAGVSSIAAGISRPHKRVDSRDSTERARGLLTAGYY